MYSYLYKKSFYRVCEFTIFNLNSQKKNSVKRMLLFLKPAAGIKNRFLGWSKKSRPYILFGPLYVIYGKKKLGNLVNTYLSLERLESYLESF